MIRDEKTVNVVYKYFERESKMIINVDQEGRKAVQQLCDIALKSAGMQNLNPVNMILRSVKLLPASVVNEETPQPKSLEKKDEAAGQDDAGKKEEKPKEEVVEDKEVGKE